MSVKPSVNIRCGVKGCNKILISLEDPPETWEGNQMVNGCPKHGGIRQGTFSQLVHRKVEQGLNPKPEIVIWSIPLRALRPLFSDMATREKSADYFVKP